MRRNPLRSASRRPKSHSSKVKWVDRNKGDRQHMDVRSRPVAKQINTSKEQGLFAPTPLLEAFRMLLSATVSGNKPKVLMLNDMSRVYMYARTTTDIYVELCEENKTEPGDENRCGKLMKSMCGTKAAALDWQSEATRSISMCVLAPAKRH